MNAAEFHGLWTGILLVIFIGIVVWAWSGKRKRDFDEAARLPLDDDDEPGSIGAETKRNHND